MYPHQRRTGPRPRGRALLALALGATLLAGGSVAADPVLEEVVGIVNRDFLLPDRLPGFNEAAEAAAASGEADIGAHLALLGLSHTGHDTADEIAYFELMDIFAPAFPEAVARLFPDGVAYSGIGVRFESVGDRVFLREVWHGGPADRAGLRRGMEVVSADGRAVHPIESFAKPGRPVPLALRRSEGGPVETVEVVPELIRPGDAYEAAAEASTAVREIEDARIGTIRMWSYGGDRSIASCSAPSARPRSLRPMPSCSTCVADGAGPRPISSTSSSAATLRW
jgi:carboxyl-terminal processing protease